MKIQWRINQSTTIDFRSDTDLLFPFSKKLFPRSSGHRVKEPFCRISSFTSTSPFVAASATVSQGAYPTYRCSIESAGCSGTSFAKDICRRKSPGDPRLCDAARCMYLCARPEMHIWPSDTHRPVQSSTPRISPGTRPDIIGQQLVRRWLELSYLFSFIASRLLIDSSAYNMLTVYKQLLPIICFPRFVSPLSSQLLNSSS